MWKSRNNVKGSVILEGEIEFENTDEGGAGSPPPNMNYLRDLANKKVSEATSATSNDTDLIFNGGKKGSDLSSEDLKSEIMLGKYTILGEKHNTNEDRATFSSFEYDGEIYHYAGVFDGHGGHNCSEFVSNKLGKHLKRSFSKPEAWENGENVMIQTFHNIDRAFCEKAIVSHDYSGSCATIVLSKDDEIIIGNIGDCRAVMVPVSKNSYQQPVEITVDHRADCTSENIRINAAGGKVKGGRVMSLQPSRSFGDIDVKLACGKDVVIASPDVDKVFVRRDVKKKKSKTNTENRPFMIIATDGVWDVLNNKQASKLVQSTLKSLRSNKSTFNIKRRNSKTTEKIGRTQNPADLCAEALVTKSLAEGSDDDITVIVILL